MTNLNTIAIALRDLHKALIEYQAEAAAFNGSPLDLYGHVMKDANFAWLRPMTALITELDGLTSDDVKDGSVDFPDYRRQVKDLITGEDVRLHLNQALQVSPNAGLAMGALKAALS